VPYSKGLLKGESLTAFDTALENVWVDPDPNLQALVLLTVDHIGQAIDNVATAVFPHCALKIQKLWMNRGMRKPYDLPTRKKAAAITKINNSLPLFPFGKQESKFSNQELVRLLKWSLPSHWRKEFDLDGYIPTLGTKAKLISECKAIKRNESIKDKECKDNNKNNNNNNNTKKNNFGKLDARAKKDDRLRNVYFFCKNCGRNRTRDSSKCFFLKDKPQWFKKRNLTSNDDASKKDCPFSRRTFRNKEVNTLACKASKKKALGLYASALKPQQDKESKAKHAKCRAMKSEDSSSSEDSMSVHKLGKTYPSQAEQQISCC
jgi:hypothetical protein